MCRRKITISCMSDLVKSSKQAHAKMKIGEELHDPTGFWSAVLDDEHEKAMPSLTYFRSLFVRSSDFAAAPVARTSIRPVTH